MKIKALITSLLLILLSVHIVNAKEETKQWSDSEIALLKTLIIDALPKFPNGIVKIEFSS